jgi:hypothetical protein
MALFGVSLSVRIFKNKWFSRFASKAGITDDELRAVVADLEAGRFDADLGGDVYKQRVARHGGGRSGGFRTIICFRSEFRSFFVYSYAKSDRENIEDDELTYFKKEARTMLRLTEAQLEEHLRKRTLIEII